MSFCFIASVVLLAITDEMHTNTFTVREIIKQRKQKHSVIGLRIILLQLCTFLETSF
jgi:hypothetical protein